MDPSNHPAFKPEISCRAAAFASSFARLYGRPRLEKVLAKLEAPFDADYVLDVSKWYSFDFMVAFLDALVDEVGDETLPYRLGFDVASPESIGFVYFMLRALGTPRAAYERVVSIGAAYNRFGSFHLDRIDDTSALLVYRSPRPEPNDRVNQVRIGQWASFPTIWGLPPARVSVLDEPRSPRLEWRYELSWQPASRTWPPAFLGAALGCGAGLLALSGPLGALVAGGLGTLTGASLGVALGARRALALKTSQLGDQDTGLVYSFRELSNQVRDIRALNEEMENRSLTLQAANEALAAQIAAREEAEARLRIADRLVSLGTLAAGVAHEINNPLTYVMLHLDVIGFKLEEGGAAVERLRRALEEPLREAREGTERVRRIVADLSLFSRQEDASKVPVDVHAVLEGALNVAGNELRHRARVERHYGDIPRVVGNEARLGQLFLNLVVNAAQSIPAGHAGDNSIVLTTSAEDDGRVRIEISDTGAGIAPEHLARIFDPFFTTKRVGEGTGLGLAICHAIVTDLGGSLTVDSTLGNGSTFSVEFPAAAPVATESTPEAAARPPLRTERRRRVLVVDDEVQIGQALELVLAAENMDVRSVTRAEEALQLIREGARFDAIVCDLMMPTLPGEEFHEALSALAPEQARRSLFITGGAFSAAGRSFLDRGDITVLRKPLDLDDLRGAILRITEEETALAS